MTQLSNKMLPEHLRARQTARRREFGVQFVAAAVAITCFFGAGALIAPLNVIRKECRLIIDPESIGKLPAQISLLGKLGTFRALAIDWASIRADRLKQEGKTYEALQLHLTVCRLAPRFANVWVNAAWNMVYNISVLKYSPEERWQWVRNGIELLRDEAIQYNPKSVTLYRELAWIYWHKIGDVLDDHHHNYKRALAVEMERVLGAVPVTLRSEEYIAWFRKIVDAHRDLNELIAADGAVANMVSKLRQVDLEPDEELLEFVARNLRNELRATGFQVDKRDTDALTARRLEVIVDSRTSDSFERLIAAVRSKVLRERYKFDLDWMLDLMVNQYGPLDWRNAFAHALYWSSWGDKVTHDYKAKNRGDEVNTARLVFFSLQNMIMKGKVVLWPNFDNPFASYLEMTPDTRLIPYLFHTYLRLSKEQFGGDPEFVEGMPAKNYRGGLVTNMHNWIELLYLEGGEKNMELARNFHAWLRENNPHPDGEPQSRYLTTLEQFVMGDILDQLHTSRAAEGLVRSFVLRALKQYSLGQKTRAVTSMNRARLCHQRWMQGTEIQLTDRIDLQPLRVILRDQIEGYMKSPAIAPLYKAKLWEQLPLEQRQMVHDRLHPYFLKLCETQTPPWAVQRAFAEPFGMAEFRSRRIDTSHRPRRAEAEEGERFKR